MPTAILRLMTLLAFVLMPFAMGAMPVAAASPTMTQAMPAGHCDDHPGDKSVPVTAKMDCAATCAAITFDAPMPASDLVPAAPPLQLLMAATFTGILPEIATPPPKA